MGNTFRMFIRIVQIQWLVPIILLAILVVGCTEGDVSSVDESKMTSGESAKEIETNTKPASDKSRFSEMITSTAILKTVSYPIVFGLMRCQVVDEIAAR